MANETKATKFTGKRITVRMPQTTHERLKKLAVLEKRSINKEVIHILTEAVADPKHLLKPESERTNVKQVHASVVDDKAVGIPVRTSHELHTALKDLAEKNRQSLNAQNLEILEHYIDQRADYLDKAN